MFEHVSTLLISKNRALVQFEGNLPVSICQDWEMVQWMMKVKRKTGVDKDGTGDTINIVSPQ